VWYTPGFTLIDSCGNEYNSTVDTFTVINNMASSGIPEYAIDSFGCSTNSVFPLPFVYLQSHPNPCQIYRFGDTLSLNFVPNLQPDLSNTYTWSCNGQQLEVSHNSYFVFDSAGFYSVSIQNSYGCIVAGTIQVSELGLNNNENSKILAYPNPVISGNYWNIELTSFSEKINEYELFDSYGKSLQSGFFEKQKLELFTPTETGIYYLKVNGYTLRLMSVHE
jgi:hypothetical protein